MSVAEDSRRVLVDRPKLKLTYLRRGRDGMGRFGGGWQWMVGARASGGLRDAIVHLLVADLRIEFPRQPTYRKIIHYTGSHSRAAAGSYRDLADADLAIDHHGRVVKDRFGPEGRMATPEELTAAEHSPALCPVRPRC